jgi:hypothetical protein
MYFDEFITPSTGTRLPGLLAVKKPKTFFLKSILQSAEDAPLSLVHHCFVWQHLLCNLGRKRMWFVTESHLLPIISCSRSILICP